MKKIIVAGADHGGLITAASLAKEGFDVTVIEQKKRKELGYDWTDVFNIECFANAGVPIPDNLNYSLKDNMTFYSSNLSSSKNPNVPINKREVKMERKEIYDILINYAKKSNVKFIYNEKIIEAITNENRVLGVKSKHNNFYADLVIDACSINSPIRCSLNDNFGIEKKLDNNGKFYVYRAFYKRSDTTIPKNKYKFYLMPHESKGISWAACEDDYIDILIGKFEKIDEKAIKQELKWLKKYNNISNKKIRGGQISEIPVRRPLSQLVYNGYSAIGDSAFMTIPLMGSGIALSAEAAKILTDVIIKNKNSNYDITDLWEYQTIFYQKFGYDLAYKDILKEFVLNLDYEDINFAFSNNIINDNILLRTTNAQELKLSFKDLLEIIKKSARKPKLLFKLSNTFLKCNKISYLCKKNPKYYSYKKVEKWKNKYLKIKA